METHPGFEPTIVTLATIVASRVLSYDTGGVTGCINKEAGGLMKSFQDGKCNGVVLVL